MTNLSGKVAREYVPGSGTISLEENLGRNVDGTSIHARLGTNST